MTETKIGTLRAVDHEGRTIHFVDWVYEGQVVDVYLTYEDAEKENGNTVKRLVCRCRDRDEWRLV